MCRIIAVECEYNRYGIISDTNGSLYDDAFFLFLPIPPANCHCGGVGDITDEKVSRVFVGHFFALRNRAETPLGEFSHWVISFYDQTTSSMCDVELTVTGIQSRIGSNR